MANPKRKAAPKGASKKKAKVELSKRPSSGPIDFRQLWRYLYRSLLVGGLVGGVLWFAAYYRYAEAKVDQRLSEKVWELPGKVYGGPVELWPGIRLSPEDLAGDLSAAGYARVLSASQAGDFSVSSDTVRMIRRAATFPGYTVKGGEVVVKFADGRVTAVTGGRAVLPPPVLASVRGAGNEERNPLALEKIPDVVRKAVLAMEDARFYRHPGVDAVGILRAVAVNLSAGSWQQGGSTLTQQLVKNLFLTPERSYRRKIEEAFIALALEKKLGKEKILQHYLNEIYLGQAGGGSICGVDAAARAWFGKSVERVNLGEAALIAGVISAPNAYSPLHHPEAALERRNIALGRMASTGVISEEDAEKAKKEPLTLHPSTGGKRAPWATDAVVELVESQLGDGAVAAQSLAVHTTIHPVLQRAAEEAVDAGLQEVINAHPKLAGLEAALVAVRNKDGAVQAIVGGKSYGDSYFNRALLSERQVGSTIKALTTLVALDKDPSLGPATRLDDSPLSVTVDGTEWSPKNYDGSYMGAVSLRKALALSRNVPAVRLASSVGMDTLQREWKEMGLSSASHYPSAALGGFGATPLQLAGAYTVFGSGGTHWMPWLVRAALNGSGEAVWERGDPGSSRHSARATFLTADMLRGVLIDGTGKNAKNYGVGPDAGGKSGTTDAYTDAWFAGFTSELSVVVWVGFDKKKEIGLTGSQAALPIWARFVAWSGTSDGTIAAPKGVVQVEVCNDSDLPPCPGCSSTRKEWFSANYAPQAACGILAGITPRPAASGPVKPAPATPPPENTPLQKFWEKLGFRKP